jgi:hypothetical protein
MSGSNLRSQSLNQTLGTLTQLPGYRCRIRWQQVTTDVGSQDRSQHSRYGLDSPFNHGLAYLQPAIVR